MAIPFQSCLIATIRRVHQYVTTPHQSRYAYFAMLEVLHTTMFRVDAYDAGCPQALHLQECTCTKEKEGYSVKTIKRMRYDPTYKPVRHGRSEKEDYGY